MKRFQVFILLLLSSVSSGLYACGYYPYGEDVRFCFFTPYSFGFDEGYRHFNYTSDWYDYAWFEGQSNENAANISLWREYCKNKVDAEAIQQAVYKLKVNEVSRKSGNAMLHYLYATKDQDAIDYLIFAKQCEQYTWDNLDPWEKDENKALKPALTLADEAGRKALAVKSNQLRQRYFFLKARLCFYYGKWQDVESIYNTHFKKSKDKNLIYYWMMFLYTQGRVDAEQNFYAAQVFAHTPDRRFVVRSNYDRDIPIEETLKYAKTPEEAANVWLLHGVRITGKGLPYLQAMYKNDPRALGLRFLMVREINKMEDWILTPQYSLFEPTTRPDYWENNNARRILNRVAEDRKYVRDVYDFIKGIDVAKTGDAAFWYLAQTYVAFLAGKNNAAAANLVKAEKTIHEKDELYNHLQMVKGLVLTANQQGSKAHIPHGVEGIIKAQFAKENHKYIFALGREIEMKGNYGLAALLFSRTNYDEDDYWGGGNTSYWKAPSNVESMFSDYYINYCSYIDAAYTPQQVAEVIQTLDGLKTKTGFEKWLYQSAIADKDELWRILGEINLRRGSLVAARDAFKNIINSKEYIYGENPFYKIKYTPEFTSDYNKKQPITRYYVVDNLIKVLKIANDPNEKDRDYYCFLAANCYYNISSYGTAWTMSRRYFSSGQYESGYPDDGNFFQCNTAAHYYAEAYKYAKTEKFKALCLRMMAECEKHKRYVTAVDWRIRYKYDLTEPPNKYEAQFKKQYKAYELDLYNEGNCTAFADYFKARR
jgi:hypothetical protein